jgi:hypothetical protein
VESEKVDILKWTVSRMVAPILDGSHGKRLIMGMKLQLDGNGEFRCAIAQVTTNNSGTACSLLKSFVRGQRRMIKGMNSSMMYLIYCKNFCKCHNVSPSSTTIKK